MDHLIQDLRYGTRTLLKSPGFTAVAVLTLALGIGANTAIFSVVDTLLLRPLPLKDPGRLVLVRDTQPGVDNAPASYPEYLDWKERSKTFEALGAFFNTTFSLTGKGEPEELPALRISAGLFPMLGLFPAQGRGFRPEEEKPGAERVALISHALWQRRFDASPSVLGTPIALAGEPYTVVGVMPPGIAFGRHPDVYIPLRLDEKRAPRGLHFMTVLGRLRSGPDLTRARAEVESMAARLRAEAVTRHGIVITPLQEQMVGDTRPALLVLFGAVGLVLLIACANVANLLLARAASRQKEIAIRRAVGASRSRLIRQLLTESLVLSLVGGGLGLLLAWWGVDLLVSAGARLPRIEEIRIDGTVLAFTAGVALLTGLLFGLAPALQASSADFHESLKEGGRQTGLGSGRQRLRSLLVVSEVALSLVLLIGAGLLIRSFVSVLDNDMGFDPSRVLALDLSLPLSSYGEPEKQAAFFKELLARVNRLPGVKGAAVVSHLPLGGNNTNSGLLIEGRTWPRDELPLADDRLVSADYFRVLGIHLVRGRTFTPRDVESSLHVAVINESLARRFFSHTDPIGKRIDMQWKTSGWQEIVGVVGDIKHDGLDLPSEPAVYVPYLQTPDSGMTLVVRATGDPLGLVGAVRAQVYGVDRNQPVSRVRTMEELVAESVGPRRLSMSLLSGFASLALFLAAVGIYGVMSTSVAQRTHEIGVRMALGARRSDVMRLVVGQGAKLTLAGLGLGLAAALPLTRLLSVLLFGVSATDPLTFCGVSFLLTAVALLACYLPARRASRVDPMAAIRCE